MCFLWKKLTATRSIILLAFSWLHGCCNRRFRFHRPVLPAPTIGEGGGHRLSAARDLRAFPLSLGPIKYGRWPVVWLSLGSGTYLVCDGDPGKCSAWAQHALLHGLFSTKALPGWVYIYNIYIDIDIHTHTYTSLSLSLARSIRVYSA